MEKRRRIWFAASLLVVSCGLVCLVFWRGPKEPAYEGRALSSWLDAYPTSWIEVGMRGKQAEDQQHADEAIRALGTNAFPLLLDWISAKDGRLKNGLISFANNHPRIPIHLHSAAQKRIMAMRGFDAAGPSARRASDRLLEIANAGDPEIKQAVMQVFGNIYAGDATDARINAVK